MNSQGVQGMSGPTSMTQFEIPSGKWTQQHAELNGLCVKILNFLNENPDIASKVEITRNLIVSAL